MRFGGVESIHVLSARMVVYSKARGRTLMERELADFAIGFPRSVPVDMKTFNLWEKRPGVLSGSSPPSRALPGILPAMNIKDSLNVTRIYSVFYRWMWSKPARGESGGGIRRAAIRALRVPSLINRVGILAVRCTSSAMQPDKRRRHQARPSAAMTIRSA